MATQAVISDAFRITIGAAFDRFHFGTIIGQPDITELKDGDFYNYFAEVKLDEFDKPYFPSKGWAIDGNFKLLTDNGWTYKTKTPVPIMNFSVKMAKRISDRITLLPSFYSQLTFASIAPIYYRSYIGGLQKTNNFGVYLPFAGLRRMELTANNVALVRLDFRLRMWQKIYTSLISNVGWYRTTIAQVREDNLMFGGGLSIAYDSMVGPIEFNICSSNLNSKLTAFFSLGYYF
jgi:NTE family protein